MSGRLPLFVDPLRLAATGFRGAGRYSLLKMTRLSTALFGEPGEIEISLEGRMEQGVAVLFGQIEGCLPLQCQRCMKQMELPIKHEFSLGVVSSDAETVRLPPGCEPLIYEGEAVALADIFEDELLLLLPIVPMHAEGKCQMELSPQESHPAPESREKRKNPFAVLKNLKSETNE